MKILKMLNNYSNQPSYIFGALQGIVAIPISLIFFMSQYAYSFSYMLQENKTISEFLSSLLGAGTVFLAISGLLADLQIIITLLIFHIEKLLKIKRLIYSISMFMFFAIMFFIYKNIDFSSGASIFGIFIFIVGIPFVILFEIIPFLILLILEKKKNIKISLFKLKIPKSIFFVGFLYWIILLIYPIILLIQQL